MEEPVITKVQLKDVVMKSPESIPNGPPPSKKLKQARLPFAPKQALTSPVTSKKRKLSDGCKVEKLPAKQAKNDDSGSENKQVIVIDDNEVSSSSEADGVHRGKDGKLEKPRNRTIMDMFAQQSEVSTTNIDPEKGNQKLETPSSAKREKQVDKELEKDDKKINTDADHEEVKCEKDNAKKLEKSCNKEVKHVNTEENDVNNDAMKSSNDGDEASDNEDSADDDKENISMLSTTAGETSVVDTSDEEAATEEVDTSINDGPDAATSSTDKDGKATSVPTTPSGVTRPRKKSVLSEKRKAEREAANQKKKEQEEIEKAAKHAERLKQKDERLEQKKQELEKKEQEKLLKVEQKKKEKLEKLEQKEKEKEAKTKQKEEEKKKKQEAIDAKTEEKKKKDDEKKKKEEEKKQAEVEQSMKKQKVQKAFVSFFTKVDKPTPATKPSQKSSRFMIFEAKKDMKLAPVVRATLMEEEKSNLDQHIENQTSKDLYIHLLKSKTVTSKSSGKTWPYEDDDLEIIDDGDVVKQEKMKAKLLLFHENYRPPYYGTWRKTSTLISPRRPLVQDTCHLDYEVDSDDEWEEEEPGESLSNSEGEEEEEEKKDVGDDDEEDDNAFFVPHGYLSEGEGCEDDEEDCTPERMKARQLAKAKAFEAEMKQRCEAVRAFFIGCLWWTPEGLPGDPNFKKLKEFTAVSLCPKSPIEVQSSSTSRNCTESPSISKTKTPKEGGDGRVGAKLKAVPDEAMPDLIRLVHGNCWSIQKLVKEFREYWSRQISTQESVDTSKDEPMDTSITEDSTSTPATPGNKMGNISKRQLNMTIKNIATYSKKDCYKRVCWFVKDEVLEKYKLTDLPVPTEWVWLTRPNKETDETQTTPKVGQGGDNPKVTPTANRNIPNSITKFTVPKSQLPAPQIDSCPSTPKSNPLQSTPQTNTPATPKAGDTHLTPKNLMSIKSAFAAIPKCKQISKSVDKDNKPGINTNHMNGKVKSSSVTSVEDDEDCMIVDETPALPLKPSKGQPTIISLLQSR